MLDERIKFDERYDCEEYGTTTLYFDAPKDLFEPYGYICDKETVSVTISLEFPTAHIEAAYAGCAVAPANDSGEDYDYFDFNFPYEDISALMSLAGL